MPETITFQSDYGPIQIEVPKSPRNPTRGDRGSDTVERVQGRFEQALGLIESVGNAIVDKVQKISDSPDQVSVELGIKFTAEANAVIASSSAEGNLVLKLSWTKDKTSATS
ncbi:CU044_2847 family protein [Lewinella sp. IMCC34183]|uniref:CU044_2847 family protein n=1 Tax=Lewinella sp. IMCC34183 TaxID=2248762 RepID=UPI000E24277D|nr:CU044_2847 family protein [Lewinella sp. IMCC34183]